jgi:hypothetical protein
MEDVGCGYQRESTEGDRLLYLETEAEARSHGVQARVAHENHCAGESKAAVHRLRRRFQSLLRQRVAETVADERDVDDEIRHLIQALGA